jgi:hypothetical protein
MHPTDDDNPLWPPEHDVTAMMRREIGQTASAPRIRRRIPFRIRRER